ncbi:MAG TPA: cytochrome c oxidase subunit II [Verrucomicrobiota bacterium]|nr:cytochrome c oxidase subunit II [Verrucomicrobiota bacterium]
MIESLYQLFHKLLGLPPLAAESGKPVDWLIILIHWLMIVLFVGWLAYFLFTLWRFRAKKHPKADHHGVRSHASSYIELVVAGIEVVILVAVAIPLWAKASDVTKIPPTDGEATTIQVVAQQFAWNCRYSGPDGTFGRQDMKLVTSDNPFGVSPDDPAGQDDVQVLNEIHVPVNKPVIAYISSKDVIHSFKVNAFRVTQDAIPGMRIPTWFKPTQEGRYQINCAQLCGNGHTSMSSGFLVVESQEEYDKWLGSRTGLATSFE